MKTKFFRLLRSTSKLDTDDIKGEFVETQIEDWLYYFTDKKVYQQICEKNKNARVTRIAGAE